MGKELVSELQRLAKKIASDPASRAFVQLADKYLEQNRLEEAIAVLSRGIAYHPTYVAARMMLGKAYLQAKQIKDAKNEFEYVTHIHPENVLAYKKLAFIYRDLNKLGEAVKICNKILKIDPYDKETKTLLASVHDEISAVDNIDSLTVAKTSSESQHPPLFETGLSDRSGQEVLMETGLSHYGEISLEGPISEAMETQPVEQGTPAGYHEMVHQAAPPPPLNLIRLKAWLGSITEKGARQ